MTISEFVLHLSRRNRLLYNIGLINLALLVICLGMFLFDSRQVMGINPWIKPMKFTLSVMLYVWTFGWLMNDFTSKLRKWIRPLSMVISITMLLEIAIILLQAARGVRSHFNIDSPLDGLLFASMGIMIALNTVVVIIVFVLFLQHHAHLPADYILSVRLGLLIFLIGNVVGGMIISHGGHTIGAVDGSEGIPFLNWSKVGGDLRIAHFLGLHSIQILPLVGYLLKQIGISLKTRVRAIIGIFMMYLLFLTFVLLHTLKGQSFF